MKRDEKFQELLRDRQVLSSQRNIDRIIGWELEILVLLAQERNNLALETLSESRDIHAILLDLKAGQDEQTDLLKIIAKVPLPLGQLEKQFLVFGAVISGRKI